MEAAERVITEVIQADVPYEFRHSTGPDWFNFRRADSEGSDKFLPLDYLKPSPWNYDKLVFPISVDTELKKLPGVVLQALMKVELAGIRSHQFQTLIKGNYVSVGFRENKPVLNYWDRNLYEATGVLNEDFLRGFTQLQVVSQGRVLRRI